MFCSALQLYFTVFVLQITECPDHTVVTQDVHLGEMDEQELAYRQLGFYFFLLIKTLSKTTPSMLEQCHAKAQSYPFFAANMFLNYGDLAEEVKTMMEIN